MTELKLKRIEHITLRKLVGDSSIGKSGATEGMLEKFVIHGLLIAIGVGSSCRYEVTPLADKWLQDHPSLPPLKMTESQASIIYRLLNGKTYDCAPPFNDRESAFFKLINEEGVTRVEKGYVLTDDGRDAFERTSYGFAHLRRIEELELSEKADAAIAEKLNGKPLGKTSKDLLSYAKIAKKVGADAYAAKLEYRAKELAARENIESIVAKELRGIEPDRVKYNFEPDMSRLNSVNLYSANSSLSGNSVVVARSRIYDRATESTIYGKFYAVSYTGTGCDSEFTEAPVIDYIARLEAAMRIAKVLNEKYLPTLIPNENTD